MESLMKKSVITQRSLDSGTKIIEQSEINRRPSTNPQDYHNGSGLITEPGTPLKPGNLIGNLNFFFVTNHSKYTYLVILKSFLP